MTIEQGVSLDRYTTLAAQELASRKVKVSWSLLILDPAWTFFKTYVLQRGFLDGLEGATIAYMAAFYTFLKSVPNLKGELLNYEQWNIDEQSVVSFAGMSFTRS